jgi:hypothetical protein
MPRPTEIEDWIWNLIWSQTERQFRSQVDERVRGHIWNHVCSQARNPVIAQAKEEIDVPDVRKD